MAVTGMAHTGVDGRTSVAVRPGRAGRAGFGTFAAKGAEEVSRIEGAARGKRQEDTPEKTFHAVARVVGAIDMDRLPTLQGLRAGLAEVVADGFGKGIAKRPAHRLAAEIRAQALAAQNEDRVAGYRVRLEKQVVLAQLVFVGRREVAYRRRAVVRSHRRPVVDGLSAGSALPPIRDRLRMIERTSASGEQYFVSVLYPSGLIEAIAMPETVDADKRNGGKRRTPRKSALPSGDMRGGTGVLAADGVPWYAAKPGRFASQRRPMGRIATPPFSLKPAAISHR